MHIHMHVCVVILKHLLLLALLIRFTKKETTAGNFALINERVLSLPYCIS